MRQALRLARRGEGRVSPNPMVGAVIVKGNKVIGKGYHQRCGGHHAETNAICSASGPVNGATIYITLEPCSHHGKTPPCAEMLLTHKPARVVVGTLDPNPLVAGRGMALLEKKGIAVTVGVLEDDCRRLNEKYFKFIRTGVPFVTLKYAQTLDGRIATAAGHSRWISSPPSRQFAHKLRAAHDAILVGASTVMQDDPELTVRLVKGQNPLRIVCDSTLQVSAEAKIFTHQNAAKTIIATTARADAQKRALFRNRGIEVLQIAKDAQGRVDLQKLLRELGRRKIASLLVEGGSAIITAFLKQALTDRIIVVIAPKIIGTGRDAIGDLCLNHMDEAIIIQHRQIFRKGDDVIIEGTIAPAEQI